MSDRVLDLEAEADYIQRMRRNLNELTRQHQASVIDAMRNESDQQGRLAKLLLKTKGLDNGD